MRFEALQAHSIPLTHEGWTGLLEVAQKLNVSVSELLEQVGHGQLVVIDSEKLEDLWDTVDGLEGLIEAKVEGTISWEQVKAEVKAELGLQEK